MKTVLVVDDQSEIRKVIRFALQKSFLIDEAQDADFALKLIQRNRPSAVLIDVMMPGNLSGFELCEHIKKDPQLKDIHVVMVSACGQVVDQELGRSLGADAYFVKPFSPKKLEEHLLKALNFNDQI